ncbi:hypothetical protein Taro_047700 [Colocasia esculenta]|uniref:Uncharacterized protein n=1 Tax=Colocasia esculenta TaxID=4460 RepID=A0A843X6W5_COLES|nr:hypothetical protein [Colocasia esculenta]
MYMIPIDVGMYNQCIVMGEAEADYVSTMAPRRRPREGVAEQVTRQEAGDALPPQQTQPLPQDAQWYCSAAATTSSGSSGFGHDSIS